MKLSMFRSDKADSNNGYGSNANTTLMNNNNSSGISFKNGLSSLRSNANARTGTRRTVGNVLTNSTDSGSVTIGPSLNPSINNSQSGRYQGPTKDKENDHGLYPDSSTSSLLPIHQQIHQQVHYGANTGSSGSSNGNNNRMPAINSSSYTRLFTKQSQPSDPNGLTTADPSPVPSGTSVSSTSNRIIRNSNGPAGSIPSANNSTNNVKVITYDAQKVVGQGTFGAVYLAKISGTEEMVAIKKVFQDPSFKNRELQIMKQLAGKPHPYIVQFKHYFTSKANDANRPDGFYLNLVLEYVPETLHSVNKQYFKRKQFMPTLFVKIYCYQMLRALAHLHGMGIAHRDIKPQNLLVDPLRHTLKLCDLGSAKCLVKGEPNVAYICSRFYRAPELILGCTEYSTAIDVWSAGCVFAELMQGTPIFPGMSAMDQIIEICRVMGTPNKEQLSVIHANYANAGDVKMPQFPQRPWASILPNASVEAIDLLKMMLDYIPNSRTTCIDACAHTYFDELRYADTTLPDGSALSKDMHSFTNEELSLGSAETMAMLSQESAPSTMRLF